MSNLKIAELFRTFSKNDLTDFEKFAKSTYFSRGRNYRPLISIIKKSHPDFNENVFNKQMIYRELYPQGKYNDQVIRNLLSGLMRIGEHFILFKKISENKSRYFRMLAEEFGNRMMYNQSEKYLNICNDHLKESGIDKEYFKNLFSIQQIKRELSQGRGNTKESIDGLSSEAFNFLFYALMEANSLIEEMVVYNHNYNANFENHPVFKFADFIDFDGLQDFLEAGKYDGSEIAKLYIAHIKLLIDHRNEGLFKMLINLI
jgi:hypothetical protein